MRKQPISAEPLSASGRCQCGIIFVCVRQTKSSFLKHPRSTVGSVRRIPRQLSQDESSVNIRIVYLSFGTHQRQNNTNGFNCNSPLLNIIYRKSFCQRPVACERYGRNDGKFSHVLLTRKKSFGCTAKLDKFERESNAHNELTWSWHLSSFLLRDSRYQVLSQGIAFQTDCLFNVRDSWLTHTLWSDTGLISNNYDT